MANPTAGFGLQPVRRIDGAALSFQLEVRRIAYNNSHVMATGDLVKSLTTGFIDAYIAADTQTAGVFFGCKYRDPNLGYTVWRPIWNAISGLASTDIVEAYIIIDPNIVFEVRNSSAVTAITVANIMENADVVVGSPTALTGQSVATLNQATLAVTATLPLRIVGLGQGAGNDNTLGNNIVEVRLNTSDLQTATGLA